MQALLQLGASALAQDDHRRTAMDAVTLLAAAPDSDTDPAVWSRIAAALAARHSAIPTASPRGRAGAPVHASSPGPTHANLQDTYNLPNSGDRVAVSAGTGTVRFRGHTKFGEGEWLGVQLDQPTGKNNGTIGGTPYFHCPPRYVCDVPVVPVMCGQARDLRADPHGDAARRYPVLACQVAHTGAGCHTHRAPLRVLILSQCMH